MSEHDRVLPPDATSTVDIEEEMKRSYIDYAMSVIIGRALPDVRDGMKPVHRRVLYGMWESGNTSASLSILRGLRLLPFSIFWMTAWLEFARRASCSWVQPFSKRLERIR